MADQPDSIRAGVCRPRRRAAADWLRGVRTRFGGLESRPLFLLPRPRCQRAPAGARAWRERRPVYSPGDALTCRCERVAKRPYAHSRMSVPRPEYRCHLRIKDRSRSTADMPGILIQNQSCLAGCCFSRDAMSVRRRQRKKHVKRHKHSKNPGWMMEAPDRMDSRTGQCAHSRLILTAWCGQPGEHLGRHMHTLKPA